MRDVGEGAPSPWGSGGAASFMASRQGEEEAFPSMASPCSSSDGALGLSHWSNAGATPTMCWPKP